MKTIFDITFDFEKSRGSYLVDSKKNETYLDWFGLYSSLPIGYNHPVFDASFEKTIAKISKLRFCNNVFKTEEMNQFLEVFGRQVFSKNIHLTCTGALAIECAIKCAMEYKKTENPMVLALKDAFHGVNSWGYITDRFFPNNERMRYYPKNDWKNLTIEEMIQALEKNTYPSLVAVVIEPVLCTRGDVYIDPTLLKKVETLCREKDICFIIDEIQTGFGTTGAMWYYQHLGLNPDILVFGKKAQVCGIVTSDKYSECLNSPYQKLAVTYDGELIDAVRCVYILKAYEKDSLVSRAAKNGDLIADLLKGKVDRLRHKGHLIAFDFPSRAERDSFLKRCVEKKFLCNSAGESSIRMRPHLAITEEEISHFDRILKKVL